MQTSNHATGAVRQSETGQRWIELQTATNGTLEVHPRTTFRIAATAVATVTIGGILAATMAADEVIIFNAGPGDKSDGKQTVTVVTTGTVNLQVAEDTIHTRP